MSGKRGASEQITRENYRDDDDDEEGVPSQPMKASADVLAKRKILKPRGRLGKTGGVSTAKAFPTFQFGNGGSNAGTNAGASAVAEAPKTNAFSMFAPKKEVQPVASSKSVEKASKIKALNDNFYDKITKEKGANPVSNFTPILKKYIDYYDKIDRDVDMDAEETTSAQQQLEQPQRRAIEDSPEEKKSTPSVSPSFSFGSTTTTATAAPSLPVFNFGSKPITKETSTEEPKEKEDAAIEIDSDDSDDSVKVEGPKFTLEKPPTTTDSVFKLSNDATTQKSSGTGPTFTFTSTGKSDSVFKLKPEAKTEAKVEIKPASKPALETTTNSFTWSPSKPLETGKDDQSKPTFQFGSNVTASKPDAKNEAAEPAFKFGSTGSTFNFGSTDEKKTEEKTEGEVAKPTATFNFGSTSTNPTAAFNFGATSSSAKPTTTFNFSAPSTTTSTDKPTFQFGSTSATSTDKPTFQFGSTSATSNGFNFGGSTAGATSQFNFTMSGSTQPGTNQSSDNKDDEKPDETEPDVQFKPVTELKEQVATSTGEENETVLYTKRSKLLHFDVEKKAYETKGVGEVKLLQHKETEKARLLLRAEGSERVILNTAIAKTLEYTNVGKGVRIPVVEGGKIETYVLRVKTDDDANALVNAIAEAKNKL